MFGLSHLFYPWGVVLQIMAIVHFVKRRPENYWLWIILIGGPIGASAYLLVEVAPDARLLGRVFQGFGRRSRIQTLETQILDNPSAGNYEDLGELDLEERKYEKAARRLQRRLMPMACGRRVPHRTIRCTLFMAAQKVHSGWATICVQFLTSIEWLAPT